MITQFSHEVFSSFYLWFEGQLTSSGAKAYSTNQSNSFTYADFDDIPNSHQGYQGNFRGIVSDHNIDIPNSGIFINGGFVTGSNPDVYIDYLNGRVILPAASGSSLNITANNTVKEIQIYPTEDDEEQLIISSDFVDSCDVNSTYLSAKNENLNQKTYILPACFLRYVKTENESFSLGGEDDSKTRIRATVLAKDNYTIDGLLSLFADKERTCIKHIPFEDDPYGQYNSLKSFPYSYSEYISGYTKSSYIDNVNTSKLDYSISMNKMEKNLLIGFIDFDLSTLRFPRG